MTWYIIVYFCALKFLSRIMFIKNKEIKNATLLRRLRGFNYSIFFLLDLVKLNKHINKTEKNNFRMIKKTTSFIRS